MINSSSPSTVTSVPDHLPNRTLSPTDTAISISSPLSLREPSPADTISPSAGFSFALSGIISPPAVSLRFLRALLARGHEVVLMPFY